MQFEYPKHYCITMKFIVMKSHNNGIINECEESRIEGDEELVEFSTIGEIGRYVIISILT